MAEIPRLEARGISKTFGTQRVLHGVDLTIRPGELHGLVGQNGCGKSTLVKVLTGYHAPDPGGEVRIDGESIRLPVRPREVRRYGVTVVHPNLGLLGGHTVLENMRIGRFGPGRVSRRIRWAQERAAADAALSRLGCDVDLEARVKDLSEEDRATVSIARALQDLDDGRGLVIFDESTRALSQPTLQHFFELVKTVLGGGASVLLISHRLEEVLEFTDRVTVMRDGDIVGSGLETKGLTEQELTRTMLGYELEKSPAARRAAGDRGAPAHVVARGLSGSIVREFDLSIAECEVVGMTGLIGSGFEEVPYLLAGAIRARAGALRIGEREFDLPGIGSLPLLRAGVALVPENREEEGLALELTVLENITLPRVAEHGKPIWLGAAWERKEAVQAIERFDVRPPWPDARAGTLSGGNQQKIQLAKWLTGDPSLLLVHSPTHAVDVGARHEIIEAMREVAAGGCPIVVASIDVEELSVLCDRILVFREGAVVAELAGELEPDDIVESTFRPAVGSTAAHDDYQ
jgi:ribose transport system ATP-binding protein